MYHTYISKKKIIHEQPFMLNLRLVNDNIRPQTLCGWFIEPSTGLILLLVILASYKHVEYLFTNEAFLYLMKTHKLICNYETSCKFIKDSIIIFIRVLTTQTSLKIDHDVWNKHSFNIINCNIKEINQNRCKSFVIFQLKLNSVVCEI